MGKEQADFVYDGLKDWLPGARARPGLVFNEQFAVWDDHISRYARSSTMEAYAASLLRCQEDDITDEEILDVERYKIDFDTVLLQHCKDHARQYASRPLAAKVVAFVHPLYAQLWHGNYASVQRDTPEALSRLSSAFDGALSGADISRVLLDDIFTYAGIIKIVVSNHRGNHIITFGI